MAISAAKRRVYTRKWYRKNSARVNAYHRRWWKKNKAKLNARARARYAANKERARAQYRKHYRKAVLAGKRHGRGYPAPTRPMPKRCECCGRKPRTLALDHEHAAKRFRGWLCSQCNVGIGMLGDSVAGVRKALRYLRRRRG